MSNLAQPTNQPDTSTVHLSLHTVIALCGCRVFCGTWNVNGQEPSVDLYEWLSAQDDGRLPDIYAIGSASRQIRPKNKLVVSGNMAKNRVGRSNLTMVLNYANANSIFTHSSLCCLTFSFYVDMLCYFSGKIIRT